MAGIIKKTIDEIISKRAHGNKTIANTTKVKLIFKGIDPDNYTETSEDDPLILDKLKEIIKDFNLNITI